MKRTFILCNLATRLAKNIQEWKETATVYIHWPYCLKRCTYCNFNKYIKDNVDHARMQKCLSTEIETLIGLSEIKKVKSIYFGGGTPSLALPETVQRILEKISSASHLEADAEITLECNPTQIESENLRNFKDAGINRVSIGVQSLNDEDLQTFGRTHSSHDSVRCVQHARYLFPGKVSLDVIFGRPKQTLSTWELELKKILNLCDAHVSLYQLTLERGTDMFKRVQDNQMALPDSSDVTDMYLHSVQVLEEMGFKRYEVSNFAVTGAESQHNLSYWNGTQYIGIGPGAHGRFQTLENISSVREARIQTLEPDVWMKEVERRGHGTRKIVSQSVHDVLEELLMTSMRTSKGLSNERWSVFSRGVCVHDVFSTWPASHRLIEDGLCFFKDGDLLPTSRGMTMADTLTLELLPAIRRQQI